MLTPTESDLEFICCFALVLAAVLDMRDFAPCRKIGLDVVAAVLLRRCASVNGYLVPHSLATRRRFDPCNVSVLT